MQTNVITITRQFGSLGRPIAKRVAEMMGYEYFDRDIIESAADKLGEPVYKLNEYDGHTITRYGKMMFPMGYGARSKQNKLFETEKRVILEFAHKENCVIVGRCSDYILADAEFEKRFSVFIFAPYEARYTNCLKTLGLTPEAAEVYMEKVDVARARFYKDYTGEDFESLKYRNLLLDSSYASIDDAASIICGAAKKKFEQ